MALATNPPGFGCRKRLTRTQQPRKGKINMSAKALATCSFEPAVEQPAATDHQAPEGHAAEIQFREDLWREYRFEAIHAGFSAAQATEYASALSPEMGVIAGVSERAPVGCGWFYESRIGVVKRTMASGLVTLARLEKSKTLGRTAGWGVPISTLGFRPWNAGGKR